MPGIDMQNIRPASDADIIANTMKAITCNNDHHRYT